MNKILNLKKNIAGTKIVFSVAVVAMLVFSLIGVQKAFATITSQLDIGDSGSEVTELQTYLTTNSIFYPSGLITGYFGPLTEAGVQKFQAAQGIVSNGTPETTGYGRVGPSTMARINSLLGSGNQTMWDDSPVLSDVSVDYTNTTATFTWTTNEQTEGQVYWDDTKLQLNEANSPRQQPYVSGAVAIDAGGLKTSHSVTVSNLDEDTIYYYLVRGIDSVGNMSMVWPSSFRTDN
jgi:peptidoglycan hydrolase-like protein with peptidoglycan-binding domain